MEDAVWLESCRIRGHLNDSDLFFWVSKKNYQIEYSSFSLFITSTLSFINIVVGTAILLLILIALKRRVIQLKTFLFIVNQLSINLLSAVIIVFVGFSAFNKESFNFNGYLALFMISFAYPAIGITQLISTVLCYIRNDFSVIYNQIRVEYLMLSNITVWILSGIFLLLFSPLFFLLDLKYQIEKNCMFYSCQFPLMMVLLFVLLLLWLVNLSSYFVVFVRLNRQERQQKTLNDAPLAKQSLKQHRTSFNFVVIYSLIGVVLILSFAWLAKSIYEVHQAKKFNFDCDTNKRLDLVDQIQAANTLITSSWILLTVLMNLFIFVSHFTKLIPLRRFKQKQINKQYGFQTISTVHLPTDKHTDP